MSMKPLFQATPAQRVGNNIRLCLKWRGMTQPQLAELVGVTPRQVARWVRGRGLDPFDLLVLAEIFTMGSESWFTDHDPEHPEGEG